MDFGRLNTDGSIVQSPQRCALTNERLADNGAQWTRIKESLLFYGLTPQAARAITDEQRAGLEAAIIAVATAGEKGRRVRNAGADTE